jgi:hypothetical protein
MLVAMGQQLQRITAAGVDVVDPASLAERVAEVAARQRSPETRCNYAAVYRSFDAFLGPGAAAGEVTPEVVRGYRDALRARRPLARHGGQAPVRAARARGSARHQ